MGVAQLAAMKSNEDERLERQVLEKEMKDEMDRLEGEERRRKWLEEIDTSRRMEEKRRESTVAVSAQSALEADTLEFHQYAEEQIKKYATEGKNIIPLIKELRSFRKRVLE